MKELAKISRFGAALLLVMGLLFNSSCKQNDPPEDVRRDATVIAVEKVMPSVVNMVAASRLQLDPFEVFMRRTYGLTAGPTNSVGSGVIIDESGYVLTSYHVVQVVPPYRIAVKLADGREFDCEPVVATKNSDVALVKIHAPAGEKFQPITFARDDDLLLGETVIAIGNPLNLGGSVTKGILSSRSRRLPMNGPLNFRDWLQTDAAINEGNSGGPLVNLLGEMIGLNEAVVTNQQNIGFAIPVKQVREAIAQFFSPEVMNSIWFGGRVSSGSGALRFTFVQPNGPAFQAGIRTGDEVVSVNGQAAHTQIQFQRALCGSATNENVAVKMVVRRSGGNYSAVAHLVSFDNLFRSKLGMTLAMSNRGWIIQSVESDSPASRAEVQPGLLLRGINGSPETSPLRLADLLSSKSPGDMIVLTFGIQQISGELVQDRNVSVNLIVR